MKRASQTDEATRARLLESGAQVFAEVGYAAATVRQICARAGVNIAAVNYHFGDKLGLYTEILKRSSGPDAQVKIRAAIAETSRPEDALGIFVRGMLEKLFGDAPEANIKIMTQEMANPTPALDIVVDQVIRPQYKQLCQLIGRVIGQAPTAETTRLCVHSLIGQVAHYAHGRAVLSRLWPTLRMNAKDRDRIADHIVAFTLGGLRAATSIKRK